VFAWLAHYRYVQVRKPGASPLTCVTRNSWERKPRGVKTSESEFSDPIPPSPTNLIYLYINEYIMDLKFKICETASDSDQRTSEFDQ
jgi:hypothetical protein